MHAGSRASSRGSSSLVVDRKGAVSAIAPPFRRPRGRWRPLREPGHDTHRARRLVGTDGRDRQDLVSASSVRAQPRSGSTIASDVAITDHGLVAPVAVEIGCQGDAGERQGAARVSGRDDARSPRRPAGGARGGRAVGPNRGRPDSSRTCMRAGLRQAVHPIRRGRRRRDGDPGSDSARPREGRCRPTRESRSSDRCRRHGSWSPTPPRARWIHHRRRRLRPHRPRPSPGGSSDQLRSAARRPVATSTRSKRSGPRRGRSTGPRSGHAPRSTSHGVSAPSPGSATVPSAIGSQSIDRSSSAILTAPCGRPAVSRVNRNGGASVPSPGWTSATSTNGRSRGPGPGGSTARTPGVPIQPATISATSNPLTTRGDDGRRAIIGAVETSSWSTSYARPRDTTSGASLRGCPTTV